MPAQSLSTKMWATRQQLAVVSTASAATLPAVTLPIAKAAPSSGEPCRIRISRQRRQGR